MRIIYLVYNISFNRIQYIINIVYCFSLNNYIGYLTLLPHYKLGEHATQSMQIIAYNNYIHTNKGK